MNMKNNLIESLFLGSLILSVIFNCNKGYSEGSCQLSPILEETVKLVKRNRFLNNRVTDELYFRLASQFEMAQCSEKELQRIILETETNENVQSLKRAMENANIHFRTKRASIKKKEKNRKIYAAQLSYIYVNKYFQRKFIYV